MSEERAPYSMVDGRVVPVSPGVLLDSHDQVAAATLDRNAIRALVDEVLRDAGHDYMQAWVDPSDEPQLRKKFEREWVLYETSIRKRLDVLLRGET